MLVFIYADKGTDEWLSTQPSQTEVWWKALGKERFSCGLW